MQKSWLNDIDPAFEQVASSELVKEQNRKSPRAGFFPRKYLFLEPDPLPAQEDGLGKA
jgi:hypothetical protein